jgi:hypothetical protein
MKVNFKNIAKILYNLHNWFGRMKATRLSYTHIRHGISLALAALYGIAGFWISIRK